MTVPKSESQRIQGSAGELEAMILDLPSVSLEDIHQAAVICHPHPLFQGTMDNKVITTLSKTFFELQIPSIRFNFRGVGRSQGTYDHGIGETADCQAVLAWGRAHWPRAKFWLAGFSFGAYIAAKVAALDPEVVQLISIAPAVHHGDFAALSGRVQCPWLVIQGEEDEVVPPSAVFSWFDELKADKTLIKMAGCTHFFHGKLIELQRLLKEHYQS